MQSNCYKHILYECGIARINKKYVDPSIFRYMKIINRILEPSTSILIFSNIPNKENAYSAIL